MQSLQNLPKMQNFITLMSIGKSSVTDSLSGCSWAGEEHVNVDGGMLILLPENCLFESALLKHSSEIFGIGAIV